jgi:tRNA dimethylallyltransferase
LIVITGPTASGKTSLSIELAQWLNTGIISADSRQFYREMKIGTAVPSNEQLAKVPHYFIGHLSIADYYNVSAYEQDVIKKLDELFQKHSFVILTGGSGLYIDAVCEGIDDMPDIPAPIREQVNRDTQKYGLDYLRRHIRDNDPEYYATVDLNNPNRMKRAVEIFETTGRPFSSFRRRDVASRNFDILKFGLQWDRETLNRRINERTDGMMKEGFLEEARNLWKYKDYNALNTVGYRELFAYLEGRISLEKAVEKIKTQTRRYAKRQMTWFKRDENIHWIDMKARPLHDIKKIIDSKHKNQAYGTDRAT